MTTDYTSLIERLHDQWANLDPVDPYRGDVAEAADAIESLQAELAKYRDAPLTREITRLRCLAYKVTPPTP